MERRGTVKSRIFGLAEAATVFSASALSLTVICMLDCPLAIHTSPTITFLSVIVFSPAMVMSNGPPAFSGARLTRHFPSLAVAVASCP